MKKLKKIPKFKSYEEEANFWDTHELSDYFDMSNPINKDHLISKKKDNILNRLKKQPLRQGLNTYK